MQKDELIQIHALLVHVRRFVEATNDCNGGFTDYDALDIAPHHLQRSKRDHKLAVFTLSQDIAANICHHHSSDSRLQEILGGIATKVATSPHRRA